jgi:hypothetical protein
MIYHQPLTKDTWITNKIVGNVRRAEEANLGQASTLDLFKLWNESNLKDNPVGEDIVELSRILVEVDLDDLKTNLEEKMDITDESLKIYLEMSDVQGTQFAPSNFSITVHPVTTAWDEGLGMDIGGLSHYGASSWSQSKPDTDWTTPGGDYGPSIAEQNFISGSEDLFVDITTWVKSVWNEETTNYGLLLKLADGIEANSYTYFVKRFGTRHSRNPYNRPKLKCSWNDFHEDDRLQFETATENTLAVKHFIKGELAPLDNVTTELTYGSWTLTPTSVGNVFIGGVEQVGWFEAVYRGIEIYGVDSAIQADLLANGTIDLTETWYSNGEMWFENTVTLKRNLITTSAKPRDYRFSLTDLKSTYSHQETPMIRLFCRDKRLDNEPVRRPIDLKSLRVERAYYRIRDYGDYTRPVVDFSYPNNDSTRLSADGEGMYFSFPTDILPHGRMYQIDILYFDRGKRYIWESKFSFSVTSN